MIFKYLNIFPALLTSNMIISLSK